MSPRFTVIIIMTTTITMYTVHMQKLVEYHTCWRISGWSSSIRRKVSDSLFAGFDCLRVSFLNRYVMMLSNVAQQPVQTIVSTTHIAIINSNHWTQILIQWAKHMSIFYLLWQGSTMMATNHDGHKQWLWRPQPWWPQTVTTNLVKFIQWC